MPTNVYDPPALERGTLRVTPLGGLAEIGTGNRKGREAWARGMLVRGMVPMFLLLPQVKLAKRLDVKGAAERGLRRLPARFVAAWERESGRAAS